MEQKSIFSFATISRLFRSARGERVIQTGQYQVAASVTVATVSGRTINCTGAHGGRKNDRIIFNNGADWVGEEFGMVRIVDADSIEVDYTFSEDDATALAGLTFRIMRPVTASYDASGSLTIVPGPITYSRNGTDTEVLEDTTVPGNNRPLPTQVMAQDGTAQKINLAVVDKVYHKIVNATAGTHIPASGAAANLELIASTSAKAFKLEWQDDIGEFIGVYTGAVLGTLVAIIGPGGTSKEVNIPAATRVSVRAMENSAISTDGVKLALHLLG